MYIIPTVRNGCLRAMGFILSNRVSRLWTSNLKFSTSEFYIKKVRVQQTVKQSSEWQNKFYSDGQYLIIDTDKEMVLLNAKKSRENLQTLMWRTSSDLNSSGFNVKEDAVFLSINDKEEYQFAVRLSSTKEKHATLESKFNGKFVTFRKSLFSLSTAESAILSQSHSLLRWKYCFNFCPSCGGQLKSQGIGAQKGCSSCSMVHYPHISPVGIVLVTNKDHGKALLVRQPRHPPGMYTCIAGFIEAGESIEENISREVAEEVGLAVTSLEYIGSQHWALPESRLMIACMATVCSEQIDIDSDELDGAEWFTPQQVHEAYQRVISKSAKIMSEPDKLWVPPRGAIAHHLIKHWLKVYHNME